MVGDSFCAQGSGRTKHSGHAPVWSGRNDGALAPAKSLVEDTDISTADVLRELGVIKRVGKRGSAYVYRTGKRR